ncbi:MAG: hypothetical protein HUK22_06975 [Thermoguttaceae bacterium]|nr:hypothetical protein [Thermoguttaceae bacterium]
MIIARYLPVFINLWKNGCKIVEGARRDYGKCASFSKKLASKAFYRVMNLLSDVEIEPNASEFRLYDRQVIEALRQMPERAKFLRASVRWLGFSRAVVPFDVNPRFAGTSSFSTKKLLCLALDGVVGFSTKPLRWIFYLGALATFSVAPYGMWALFQFCFLGVKTPGWTSIILLNMFLGGCILLSLGVIGEYIGRIYAEVKRRPMYVVEEARGVARADSGKMDDYEERAA